MNERIRELIKQSGGHFSTHNLMSNPVQHRESIELWDKNIEKFAELIVKECMTMCDETRADYFKHRKAADDFTDKNIYAEGEAASDIIKYKIKKHFGVEA